MHPTLLRDTRKEQKVMVLLGIENNPKELIESETIEMPSFKLRNFQNSYLAYRWLIARMDKPKQLKQVQAIVCRHEFLLDEDFMLLRAIKNHENLRLIPFISIYKNDRPDALKSIEMGIDDSFAMPVNSNILEARINFLQEFKKDNIDKEEQPEEEINKFQLPIAKRLFDIVFSTITILLVSPLLLLTAIAIKATDGGNIIYRSKRVGTGYEVFDFLKFRSMYPDADKRLAEMQSLNQYDSNSVFKKFANDPRITPIGRIIRKLSIDELPQLFNVLRGNMSIVGNRPLPLYEAEALTKDDWVKRFLAPAGITGLWQVTKRGKNNMSVEERIDLDISYAENWSFWYDMKLVLKTPFSIIQRENV